MKNLRPYLLGFALSVVLTLAAFWLVSQDFSREVAMALLITLAVAQLWVQLFCFLHLGDEQKPRWHAITLVFAAFVVIVLVGGSIWIMHHLEHGMMEDTSDTW